MAEERPTRESMASLSFLTFADGVADPRLAAVPTESEVSMTQEDEPLPHL